jgi:hypothetical protein
MDGWTSWRRTAGVRQVTAHLLSKLDVRGNNVLCAAATTTSTASTCCTQTSPLRQSVMVMRSVHQQTVAVAKEHALVETVVAFKPPPQRSPVLKVTAAPRDLDADGVM